MNAHSLDKPESPIILQCLPSRVPLHHSLRICDCFGGSAYSFQLGHYLPGKKYDE